MTDLGGINLGCNSLSLEQQLSETLELESVMEAYDRYQAKFPNHTVGLLHSRMNGEEKQSVIAQFRNHQTQILVSTTVIEVGIDVPNATVIAIEHAERFGLSQLHQLRGRVGRGHTQLYCLLMNASDSTTARERLEVLERSANGFADTLRGSRRQRRNGSPASGCR
ncbi:MULTISPECIES: helicase-related protein [Leptolyngbya]|uniref:helicase-related protein n=1 Tax=Leptolyngbya TaxID=47251 RepID=UPI001F55A0EC|nr:helicase-related protein [Leptolyngbya sp. FACHB-1624]